MSILKNRIEKLEALQKPHTLVIVRFDSEGRHYYNNDVYQTYEDATEAIKKLYDNPLVIAIHEAVL